MKLTAIQNFLKLLKKHTMSQFSSQSIAKEDSAEVIFIILRYSLINCCKTTKYLSLF